MRQRAIQPFQLPPWLLEEVGHATGRGVRIGVIDSGCDPHVSSLGLNVSKGIAFLSPKDSEQARLLALPGNTTDVIGHGTSCATSIHRIAPGAEIVPIRVFEHSLETSTDSLCAAIRWGVEQRLSILNVSIATALPDAREPLLAECAAAAGAGVLVVAAGTTEQECPLYPADLDTVLSVGIGPFWSAFDFEVRSRDVVDVRAACGQSGSVISLGAELIRATGPSFCVPNIAGIIALLLESGVVADIVEVRERLARMSVHSRRAGIRPKPPASAGGRITVVTREPTAGSVRSMSENLQASEFIAEARRIADLVIDNAEVQSDGSLSWGRGYGVSLQPVTDAGIFNGRIGEALFLSAMYKATGSRRYAERALAAVAPLRRRAYSAGAATQIAKEVGLGLTGLGSITYALIRIAQWLDEPAIAGAAEAIAARITRNIIASDRRLEMFWGCSSMLLAFLALDEAGSGSALRKAKWCGDHLVAMQRRDPVTGMKAWITSDRVPTAGFAHGNSGIAHALLQLYHKVPAQEYYAPALDAFAFERSIFREEVLEWPDSRDQPSDRLMSSWCHGAAGIGLARLSLVDVVKQEHEEAVASDLYYALKKIAGLPVHGPDNLCCGNAGRIDFLLEAGRKLGNEGLVKLAIQRGSACVIKARERGGYTLPDRSGDEPHLQPGLWQGDAGIGYMMLRLAAPDTFPSVLLLR